MKIEKITPRIGAAITGIDVTRPLSTNEIEAIADALNANGVIFFPGQPTLSGEEQRAFARQFGTVEAPPKLTKESELRDVLILDFTRPACRERDRHLAQRRQLSRLPADGIDPPGAYPA